MNVDTAKLNALFAPPADLGAPCVIKAVDVWKVYKMGKLETQALRGANVEVVQGDIEGDLAAAVDGVDAVYYLVHSIGEGTDWAERESAGAANLRDAATQAGVRRIVYLGGLGDEDEGLSPHMRSRHEVGRILRTSGATVIELRASREIDRHGWSPSFVRTTRARSATVAIASSSSGSRITRK